MKNIRRLQVFDFWLSDGQANDDGCHIYDFRGLNFKKFAYRNRDATFDGVVLFLINIPSFYHNLFHVFGEYLGTKRMFLVTFFAQKAPKKTPGNEISLTLKKIISRIINSSFEKTANARS